MLYPGFHGMSVGTSPTRRQSDYAVMVQPGLPLPPMLTSYLALPQCSFRDCLSHMAGVKPPDSSPLSLEPLAFSSIGNYIIHLDLRTECPGLTPTCQPLAAHTALLSIHFHSQPMHPWTGLRVPLLRHRAHSNLLSTLWGTASVHMRQLP